jgi:5-methyltetrahydropteroyltriglutamate--homocysteine methyltransferase
MLEDNFDPTLREKLSFAIQKLEELSFLSNALKKVFDSCAEPCLGRRTMKEAVFEEHLVTRSESYEERRKKQHVYPAFPTTTIGSFPQTSTIRKVRLQYKKGQISETEYREAIAAEIGYCIGIQVVLDLDVLVHGEAERSDMVCVSCQRVFMVWNIVSMDYII